MLYNMITWVFTTGVPYYIMFGMGVFVLVLASELYTQHIRGPEYITYLQKYSKDSKGSMKMKKFLLFFCLWPLIIFTFLQAIWKNRSWMEHIIESSKEKTEKLNKLGKNS